MKRPDPRGRVVSVPRPPEPIQGVEPSADYTRVSERLRKGQDQHGRPRATVEVQGMDSRTRPEPGKMPLVDFTPGSAPPDETELARQAQQLAFQQRALDDALSFEARARAAGAMQGPKADDQFRAKVRASEQSYRYQRSARP